MRGASLRRGTLTRGCQQMRGLTRCSERAGSKWCFRLPPEGLAAPGSAQAGADEPLALPASAAPFNFRGWRAIINYLPPAATTGQATCDTEQMIFHPHSSGGDPCLSLPACCRGPQPPAPKSQGEQAVPTRQGTLEERWQHLATTARCPPGAAISPHRLGTPD